MPRKRRGVFLCSGTGLMTALLGRSMPNRFPDHGAYADAPGFLYSTRLRKSGHYKKSPGIKGYRMVKSCRLIEAYAVSADLALQDAL
jgi:hypothetical protein